MKYLSNLPLKQKLSCIILSVLTLILLFFLLALQISKYSYNEQLYRAIAGNLSGFLKDFSQKLRWDSAHDREVAAVSEAGVNQSYTGQIILLICLLVSGYNFI